MKEKDLEYLQQIIDDSWGEDENFTEGLYNMCNKDRAFCEIIITKEPIFNRYTYDINNWSDLAYEIINDECFENPDYSSYIEEIDKIKDNEEECKKRFYNEGWRIDTISGIAIGFDIKELKDLGYEI